MVFSTSAYAVPIKYVGPGPNTEVINGVVSGAYNLEVNEKTLEAYCNDFNTRISINHTWDGIIYSLADINDGVSSKFTNVEKYNQVAHLLNMETGISDGKLNNVIWEIFTPGSIVNMSTEASVVFNNITSGAYNTYEHSNVFVITPNPYNSSQEFMYVTQVSEPVGLFGLGLLGLMGFRRFNIET